MAVSLDFSFAVLHAPFILFSFAGHGLSCFEGLDSFLWAVLLQSSVVVTESEKSKLFEGVDVGFSGLECVSCAPDES